MRKTFLPLFISILFYALFGCANQGQLSGGNKDTRPPAVDSLESTPNYQTNFQKQKIEFLFDEWVQLNDVFNQVVVSPPLQENFKVTLKKKTVRFEFDEKEVLRENATYTINFGDCVQDLTERNPAKDLRFVFSTGDFIDSLEVSGVIVDATTKQPAKDVIVMLYDNLADSVVRTEKPFYFGKTDESGKFTIKNVRADTFKTFALMDENANYLFDNPTEKIGFLEKPIVVTDTTKVNVSIQIFEEEAQLQLKSEEKKKYGRIALGFNRKPNDGEWKVSFDPKDIKNYVQLNDRDSVIVWYDLPTESSWNLLITTDTFPTDTIGVSKISKSKFLKDKKLSLTSGENSRTNIEVNPFKPYSISFKRPLENFDTNLIVLLEDSLKQQVYPTFSIDPLDKRNLLVNFSFKEKTPYEIIFPPNSVTDFFGIKNDSIIQNLEIKSKDSYGNLTLNVLDLIPEENIILELMDENDKLVERMQVTGDTIFSKIFSKIELGNYSVNIIKDNNKNGKWDTGNYDRKSQPESVFTRTLKEVIAGWDVESTVSVDEKKSIREPDTSSSKDGETREVKPTKGKGKKPKKSKN